MRPVATPRTYARGDPVQIVVKNGPLRGTWLDAVVTRAADASAARGQRGSTLDIRTGALEGRLAKFSHKDVRGVPAADLRSRG
jgi:hypothetical protein